MPASVSVSEMGRIGGKTPHPGYPNRWTGAEWAAQKILPLFTFALSHPLKLSFTCYCTATNIATGLLRNNT
jgi:hypothetical protein